MVVTEESVIEVLEQAGCAMSIDAIHKNISSEDIYCECCGGWLQSAIDNREDVREHLRTLINQGRVASTPNWEYKLVR